MSPRRIPAARVDAVDVPPPVTTHPDRLDAVRLGPEASVVQPDPARRLALDPELAAHVRTMCDDAHAAGVAEGRTAATEEAAARGDQVARAVALAATDVAEHLERTRQATIGGVVDLSRRIAEAVIGRTPHDGGAAALDRVATALDQLEERPLRLQVSTTDLAAFEQAFATVDGVEIGPDPQLRPGEARLVGGWSHADLTEAAAWDAVARALD